MKAERQKDSVREAFHERMHANNMYGLWELASQMTAQPQPKMIPHMWPWSVTEAIIAESAAAVPVGAVEGSWAPSAAYFAKRRPHCDSRSQRS